MFDEVDLDKCIIQLESDLPDKGGEDIIAIFGRKVTSDLSIHFENHFSKIEIREMRFSSLYGELLENYSLKQETLRQLFDKMTSEISQVINGEKLQNLVQDFGNCKYPEGRLAIASFIIATLMEENS
jgi:hypothetical protein